ASGPKRRRQVVSGALPPGAAKTHFGKYCALRGRRLETARLETACSADATGRRDAGGAGRSTRGDSETTLDFPRPALWVLGPSGCRSAAREVLRSGRRGRRAPVPEPGA